MPQGYVQVILGGQTIPQGIRDALQRTGATVGFESLTEALRSGLKPTADAFLVIPDEDAPAGQQGLREILSRAANQPRGTLLIKTQADDQLQDVPANCVSVTVNESGGVEELAARISTMIELRPSLEKLARSRGGIRSSDEKLAQAYEQQLRIAGRVQREFLPHVLPRLDDFSFSAVYRPREYVSGDIYDVRRLGENHVAIALADVQGHGIGAALMTVFIKRALGGESRHGKLFRPSSPDEVLTRLNEELIEADLSETQFVSVVYALLDLRRRRLEIARGGAPYPLWRHADGTCEPLATPGFLIGVLPGATFAVEAIEMKPGDELVFYTDGLEQILLNQVPVKTPANSAPNCATRFGSSSVPPRFSPCESFANTPPDRLIAATEWYQGLCQSGVDSALAGIHSRYDTLRRLGRELDDLTVLALRCN